MLAVVHGELYHLKAARPEGDMGEANRKREQFRAAFKACIYCGNMCKLTMDHVPPKGIFPPPRPTILITVPACETCNEGAADIDAAFKAAIALQVNPRLTPSNAALAKAGHATLDKNKRLVREFFGHNRDVWVTEEGGLIRPTREFLWPVKYHDEVIKRITKGLYFHETKKSLFELGCDVEAFFHGKGIEEMSEIARSMNMRSVGTQQFNYSFGIAEEDARQSVWFYEFYETHYAAARTFPIGDPG